MSRRPEKIDCRASRRDFIFANFAGRSFSTPTSYTSVDWSLDWFEVWGLNAERRKRFINGALYDGENLTAEATSLFVVLRPGAA